jgi:hypothetical protein
MESTGTGDDEEEDEEPYEGRVCRLLHGKRREVAISSPPPRSPQSEVNSASSIFQRSLRKYKPLRHFHGTLVRSWLEVDDNLDKSWHRLPTLRERCWLTGRLAAKQN